MNRTNRTSVFRLSGVKAGVRALPDHRAPYIRGGMGHKSAVDLFHHSFFLLLLYQRCLPTTTRPDRADTEEKGKTEATPPFLPLYRQTGRGFGAGFVTGFGAYPAPPYGGRFRPNYPCGKALYPSGGWQGQRDASPASEFLLGIPPGSETYRILGHIGHNWC